MLYNVNLRHKRQALVDLSCRRVAIYQHHHHVEVCSGTDARSFSNLLFGDVDPSLRCWTSLAPKSIGVDQISPLFSFINTSKLIVFYALCTSRPKLLVRTSGCRDWWPLSNEYFLPLGCRLDCSLFVFVTIFGHAVAFTRSSLQAGDSCSYMDV